MDGPVPVIRQAGEGDRRSFLGGGLHTWKLLAEDTGGQLFLFEDQVSQGKCTPFHAHPEADELTYVLEGEILVQIDGTETVVGAGGLSFVPRGVAHAFFVRSQRARLLSLQTPGVGQGFYRDASDATTDDESDLVDLHRLQASAREHPSGIEVLGPPPFDAVTA
jgi:quercetin dioxygenase-like cupin family protein